MERSPGRGAIFFYELQAFIMSPKERPRSGMSKKCFEALKQFVKGKAKKPPSNC